MSMISEVVSTRNQSSVASTDWIFEPDKNLILKLDFSLKRTVWVLFGWHGEAALLTLFDAISDCSKVVVMINPAVDSVDPDFRSAFEALVEREGWGDKRIALVSNEDAAALASSANAEIDRDLFDQWKPVITKRYAEMHGSHVAEVIRAIAKVFNSSNLEKSTRKHVTSHFVKNLLLNFATISSRYALADVQDKLKNRPAVVVAAGPSLNKQLPTLKKYQHLLTLIAVDSVWSVLTQHGITPDVVVALDTLNVPAWTKDQFDAKSLLVLDVGCNQEMFGSVASPMLVTSNHPTEASLCAALGTPVDAFPSGGSVATKAFNLAIWMGANPVIFVGQDLAYTDGKDHADGYQYAGDYETGLRAERSAIGFDVDGYYGGRVRTERQFMHYKHWFEGRIKQLDPATMVINCTEGGARIDGAVQLPLLSVCNELTTVHTSKPMLLNLTPSHTENLSVSDRQTAVAALRDRVIRFGRLATNGLSYIEEVRSKTLTKTLRKVDAINRQLQLEDPDIKYLVDTFAVQELEEVRRKTLRDDRSEGKDQISLNRYKEIYQAIESAADLIEGALNRLNSYIEDIHLRRVIVSNESASFVWSEMSSVIKSDSARPA